ncbi:MAG: hypothetical protein IPK50_05520 [Fibrobacterota bacterium]|nr:hypothetical protein [Fibrobacterota bacterium]QQS06354.1 MAG: hypothetical protein IPK50_05520 [Fibrobacterota bacterium]
MTSQAKSEEPQEIDLTKIASILLKRRAIVLATAFVFTAISLVYAVFIAKPIFESSALLIPVESTNPDQMGAAAAIFGKKIGKSSDVELYQGLLTSRTVIQKLLFSEFKNASDTGKGQLEPLFKILKIDTSKQDRVENSIKLIAKSISVDSKSAESGSILEIKFSAGSAWLAQEMGNALLSIGQEELKNVRMERSSIILTRLTSVVNETKHDWDSTAKVLALYKDRNRSISLPEQQLTVYRLEMEKNAKEQKYLLIRKEYDLQQIERAKATPPMLILDPANLPATKSKPKRSLILMIGCLCGVIFGSSLALVIHLVDESNKR